MDKNQELKVLHTSSTADGGFSIGYNVKNIHYELEIDYDGEISLSIKEGKESHSVTDYKTLYQPK